MASPTMGRATIGERIRQIRGERSREEFALKIGIHKNTLANYEQGRRSPDSLFLVTLCRLEKVDPAWLLDGSKRVDRPYNRDLLERVGNTLARLVPHPLGLKTGKFLVNVYERAAEVQAADSDIETIAKGALELLELSSGNGQSGPEPANGEEMLCQKG